MPADRLPFRRTASPGCNIVFKCAAQASWVGKFRVSPCPADLAASLHNVVDADPAAIAYAESLAQSQASFDPMAKALAAPPNLIDNTLRELTLAAVARHAPNIVLVSTPFPGNVYGAFRIAHAVKR